VPFDLPAPFIRKRIESGKVVAFLGAGASLGARNPAAQVWNSADADLLPTATELSEYLAKPIRFPAHENDKELTKVAKYFELMTSRADLEEELRGVFARPARHSAIHEYLANNPAPLLIITTNYDNLIEQALAARGREFDVVVHLTSITLKRVSNFAVADSLLWRPHNEAPRFATDDDLARIDLSKRFVVYKMHGSVDRDKPDHDSYVITEDDYVDFLTRMTSQSASAIPSIVAQHIAQRALLFLGYGLRDWNLRVLLTQIDRLNRRDKTSWAVQVNPSELEMELWKKRSVQIFDMRLDEFVEEMKKAEV